LNLLRDSDIKTSKRLQRFAHQLDELLTGRLGAEGGSQVDRTWSRRGGGEAL